MFGYGVLVGLFLGVFFGILVVGLCIAAGREDDLAGRE